MLLRLFILNVLRNTEADRHFMVKCRAVSVKAGGAYCNYCALKRVEHVHAIKVAHGANDIPSSDVRMSEYYVRTHLYHPRSVSTQCLASLFLTPCV
jgi:hypothetical protein